MYIYCRFKPCFQLTLCFSFVPFSLFFGWMISFYFIPVSSFCFLWMYCLFLICDCPIFVFCKLVQPLWKTVWRFLRKLNIELPYDPAIPLLSIYPDKTTIHKDTCTCMSIAELFPTAKTWNSLNVHRQMNGLRRCGNICNGYYSVIKKGQNSHLQQHGCN